MNWKKLIATGFGTGCLPVAPGSCGTLLGIPLYLGLHPLHPAFYILGLVLLGASGVYLSGEAERHIGRKDPGEIVIDEIAAFPLTMFLIPLNTGTLVLGFLLNRLMDIAKPWPCRPIQALPGGWGIMLDDLMAAVYSCALLHLALRFWPVLAGL
ncbi:MAG: phosphatidylglycerophosphatase A [Verrucomicrobia bacterium]|nr:phosphatidylglycerophosphatase A [Verrucomicrobiota bacterium]